MGLLTKWQPVVPTHSRACLTEPNNRCSPHKTHTKESLASDTNQYAMIMRSIAPCPHTYDYFKGFTSVPADHVD